MPTELELALGVLPEPLRDELIKEYKHIQGNFYGRKWSPAELSGGRFSEIVYSVIKGHADGSYPLRAYKPRNFLEACNSLEQEISLPRSFRILIPRLLPSLYEIRNNRGVGHVGGDVDPNFMDSSLILSASSWVMAELIRVLHMVTVEEAQAIVSSLAAIKSPVVWLSGDTRRILVPNLKLSDQVLVFVGSSEESILFDSLVTWIEHSSSKYIKRVVNNLHKARFLEFNNNEGTIEILPPGMRRLQEILDTLE